LGHPSHKSIGNPSRNKSKGEAQHAALTLRSGRVSMKIGEKQTRSSVDAILPEITSL